MSIESEIQSEVEALKARFNETKTLYREVWGDLSFSANQPNCFKNNHLAANLGAEYGVSPT